MHRLPAGQHAAALGSASSTQAATRRPRCVRVSRATPANSPPRLRSSCMTHLVVNTLTWSPSSLASRSFASPRLHIARRLQVCVRQVTAVCVYVCASRQPPAQGPLVSTARASACLLGQLEAGAGCTTASSGGRFARAATRPGHPLHCQGTPGRPHRPHPPRCMRPLPPWQPAKALAGPLVRPLQLTSWPAVRAQSCRPAAPCRAA